MFRDYLFVFDLDFTLWNCGGTWCDHSNPPYSKMNDKIFDSNAVEMRLYPDVIHILEELFHSGAKIAVASRTTEADWAKDLMRLHGIYPYFKYKAIYPGSKISHFKYLKEKTGFPYERMIFFDDEQRNLQEVSTLGVNCVEVSGGLSYDLYKYSCLEVVRNAMV